MNIKSKTFLEILTNHSKDPAKVKRKLQNDKRLSRDEKNIMECFLLLRNNKNSDGMKLAKSIPVQSDDFIESMRLFVIGSFASNLGFFMDSQDHFNQSFDKLPKGTLPHYEFIILHNLFTLEINLRNLDGAEKLIEKMASIKNLSFEHELLWKKCHFNFATLSGQEELAFVLLSELKPNLNHFQPAARALFALDVWDYGVVFEDFHHCFEALDIMQGQYNFVLTQNLTYMKAMLNHLLNDEPIYFLESEFKLYPILKYQMLVIRFLENNKFADAREAWNFLHEFRPWAFGKDFQTVGPKTIFSLCLSKYSGKFEAQPKLKRVEGLSIMESIKHALLTQKSITKVDMFEYLYGRRPETKDDYNRLARDIYKFKSQFKWEINSKKGNYSLIKKAA